MIVELGLEGAHQRTVLAAEKLPPGAVPRQHIVVPRVDEGTVNGGGGAVGEGVVAAAPADRQAAADAAVVANQGEKGLL